MSTDLDDFFFNTRPNVVEIETLTISHSAFSGVHRLVRNAPDETVLDGQTYTYVPMQIKPLASQTDLDQEIEVTLGDLGDVVASELELVDDANAWQEKPICVYQTFRSDDTSAPMFGPVTLRIDAVSLTEEGAVFRAKSASYNITKTGEVYDLLRFPMLVPL